MNENPVVRRYRHGGQGVLLEALDAPDVTAVQTVGRTALAQTHGKLRDLVHGDLYDYSAIGSQLAPFDACFFCLGVTSAGKTEADYSRLTYDLTMAAATALARLNPQMTFVYVSGAGTDGTERGRSMWARVKGRTENALLALPFTSVYLFRPGLIQPLRGVRSKTSSYQMLYTVISPILPLLRWMMPSTVLTTEVVGQAMLAVARAGAPKNILEAADINALGTPSAR